MTGIIDSEQEKGNGITEGSREESREAIWGYQITEKINLTKHWKTKGK